MVSIFLSIGEIILLCPWIIWGFLCIVLKKISYTKTSAVHFASDITTFFLLFSIREIIKVLFDTDIRMLAFIAAVVIAIVMLVYDYKNEDELELSKVTKKIWRILFVLLTCVYIVVFISFAVMWCIQMFK